MRLKADENIASRVVQFLRENGHDIQTVRGERLVGAADPRLAEAAAAEQRMILTVDRGFGDVRRYPPGTHPGMVVVHARELRTSIVLMLVATLLTEHDFDEFVGCNVIVEPGALRVRRP